MQTHQMAQLPQMNDINDTKSRQLVVAGCTEFMNGIIDTEEDAKILRERGIAMNQLKSDLEVANMWNGMNKSLRLTKVLKLDMVIEDVNKFYSGTTMVKVQKFMKRSQFTLGNNITQTSEFRGRNRNAPPSAAVSHGPPEGPLLRRGLILSQFSFTESMDATMDL
ncbi:hypothetical protein PIB30_050742 [Stylosanthes scabra]|uniref:Uncharacterized protein n=1 Tax=Stylosanthes scabra TaxID=79078 RepID=A0ABU6RI54_9FABA|nr:hypothetical protein [Stylosanthes scabra]